MALPRRQQRLLEAIDHQMTSADPRLAWLLGAFGRLWAGEPLPAREQLTTPASRFWSGLWEAIPAPPGRARPGPYGPAQNGQDDRQPPGRG